MSKGSLEAYSRNAHHVQNIIYVKESSLNSYHFGTEFRKYICLEFVIHLFVFIHNQLN